MTRTSATLKLAGAAIAVAVSATCSGGQSAPAAPSATPTPAAPAITLASITLDPSSARGGTMVTGTAVLSAAAGADAVVVSLSSSGAEAPVPASVTVAAGASSATFTIETKTVASNTEVTITGAAGGESRQAALQLTAEPTPPAPVLASLRLAAGELRGGQSTTATVTLDRAAPADGTAVTLSSSAAAAAVPASVTVASGASTATFAIDTKAVTSATTVTITAAAGGHTRTAALQVTAEPPPVLASFDINPRRFFGGEPTRASVTLDRAAPADGTVVTLQSSKREARVPDSVTVPAGAASVSFGFTTGDVSNDMEVLVTATAGGVSKSVQIRLLPKSSPPPPVTTGTVTIGGAVR